jgi:hypothetical protein
MVGTPHRNQRQLQHLEFWRENALESFSECFYMNEPMLHENW